MQNEPIKVGDLVIIVGVCCDTKNLGLIRTVTGKGCKRTRCRTCDRAYGMPNSFLNHGDDCYPDIFLKKITPPPESVFENDTQDEEITA